jgi:hypothetical protein
MTTAVHFSAPLRPGIFLVGTILLLLLAAGGVAFVGTRDETPTETVAPPPAPHSDVVRIDLPHEAFPVPPGENREAFVASCVQCHSARLAFTQPRFPAKTWAAVVAKMANVYKAPLSADEQKKIVAYLSSVHGE